MWWPLVLAAGWWAMRPRSPRRRTVVAGFPASPLPVYALFSWEVARGPAGRVLGPYGMSPSRAVTYAIGRSVCAYYRRRGLLRSWMIDVYQLSPGHETGLAGAPERHWQYVRGVRC